MPQDHFLHKQVMQLAKQTHILNETIKTQNISFNVAKKSLALHEEQSTYTKQLKTHVAKFSEIKNGLEKSKTDLYKQYLKIKKTIESLLLEKSSVSESASFRPPYLETNFEEEQPSRKKGKNKAE